MNKLRDRYYEEAYLYPAPPKHEDRILAVVVEKKGDETRTSMRQSEIYAFSNDIIIRDGYMVMPKIHWKSYEPGDWFMTERIFSTDRHGKLKEEKELTDLHKIDPSAYEKFNIPPTKFENGNVMIIMPFVLCPEFIRNRETRNSYGSYKKLYLMNFGQGFVHNRQDRLLKKLRDGYVYKGIFEFHSRDNGAVNFAHRSEIRDNTGHILERDAMWELTDLIDEAPVPIDKHEEIREDLKDLKEYAIKYDKELEARGYYSTSRSVRKEVLREFNAAAPPPLRLRCTQLPPKSLEPTVDEDLGFGQMTIEEDRSWTLKPSVVAPAPAAAAEAPIPLPRRRTALRNETIANESAFAEDTTLNASQVRLFDNQPYDDLRSRQEFEAYRAQVIVRSMFENPKTKVLEAKWIDRETGETSIDRDLLDFKFDCRYAIPPSPPAPTPIRHDFNDTFSTIASTSILQRPLARSTPFGSPERRIRQGGFHNETDTTVTLVEMRRDNNANPIGPRRRL